MFECRICLEEDEEENLISPCLCRGTTKYIHEECLNEWRTLSENTDNQTICPQCKFEYVLEEREIVLDNNITFKLIKLFGNSFAKLIFFNFFVLGLMSYIFFLLNNLNFYFYGDDDDDLEDIFELKTLNILQLSSLLISFFYIVIFLYDFIKTKNRMLLVSYYLRQSIVWHSIFFITGCFFLFTSPLIGLFLITLFINNILKIYLNFHQEINSSKNNKVISLTDQELIELNF